MKVRLLRGMSWILVLSLLAALLLPIAAGVERAQAGGGWSVWLYNDATGEMVRVHPDGSTEAYASPLPAEGSALTYALTFSRDGDRMAFCLMDDTGVTSVRVYDFPLALYRGVYEVPGMVQGCWLEPGSFSEDGMLLAVGLFNHYPDPADPRPEWELIVMNAETGAVIRRLTARDPQIAALGLNISGTIPAVVTFEPETPAFPGEIAFRPIQYGTEGMQEYHSLIWRLADNIVRVEGYHGKGGFNLLQDTGEAVFQDVYDWLPQGRLEGPGYLYNVILYAPPGGEPYIVYHGGAAVLGSPTFIDGGRRIAVYSYTSPGPPVWYSIDRTGMVELLPIAGEVYRVWGLGGSVVYLTDGGVEREAPVLYQTLFRENGTITTDELWRGEPGEFWRVAWVTPMLANSDLPPFEPFAVVGEPPSITPTAPPSAPPVLAVGGSALTITTEGDLLRVRSGPGLSFPVLFGLANGTLVTLREGPVAADGYNWWRVETADGRTGWAVDGVIEGSGWLQTLIPVGG